LRSAELEEIRDFVPASSRILELGGGNGYQAAILSTWGHYLTSVDIALPSPGYIRYFPVSLYNGKILEFEGEKFDVVFSSNVLEHVKDVASLLAESRRVLCRDGTAIHILPSPYWRVWTSVSHYAYLALRAIGRAQPVSDNVGPSVMEKIQHKGIWYLIMRGLVAGPHGEYPSALSEVYYFSKHRWTKVFHNAGFEVVRTFRSGIFYTGYALLPKLSLESRNKIAKMLGSATYIYILRPR